jgi:hypothetical protein
MDTKVHGFCDSKCAYEVVPKEDMAEFLTALLTELNVRSIYAGTAEPSGGKDGDIYIQYLEG